MPLSTELLNAVPPPEVLTYDFVIRSLRRRLWKAFQEDDGETALRAYQASREDFEQWLQEEEQLRKLAAQDQAAADAASYKVSAQINKTNTFCNTSDTYK
jgi:hypothetical protein